MDLHLTSIMIRSAKQLWLAPDSFLISPRSVNDPLFTSVVIENISEPFGIPPNAFGNTINRLWLNHVIIKQFSSNSLIGINPGVEIHVSRSKIYPALITDDTPTLIQVGFIMFNDVIFDNVAHTFLKLSIQDHILFKKVHLDLSASEAIVITDAHNVIIEESIIRLDRAMAINALSNMVIMRNTTLIQPQKQSLLGLTGINETSTLEMENIVLEDPALGTLLTEFPVVKFKNITVDRCNSYGGCDLIMNLIEGQNSIGIRRLPPLLIKDMLELLRNETYCFPEGNKTVTPVRPNCLGETKDTVYGLVIGFLIAALLLGCLVLGGITYGWHRKLQAKYAAVRKWSFVVPNTYKEDAVVQFNEEVEYIPRPNSTIFAIDGNYAYALQSDPAYARTKDRKKSVYQPPPAPDLVKNLQTAKAFGFNDDHDYQEIADNVEMRSSDGQPSFIRRKTVFFRQFDKRPNSAATNDSSESCSNSVVINDKTDHQYANQASI